MSFNSITLVGNLGRDPELRYSAQGTPICQFTMATNDRIQKNGEWVKHTTWFRVTVFGKQAESCSQYLQKGRQVYVQGRMRTEEYVDRNGDKRFSNEVIADSRGVQFLGKAPGEAEHQEAMSSDAQRSRGYTNERPSDLSDDDIPF